MKTPSLQDRFSSLKACVLIPTYNNSATLKNVLEDVLGQTTSVIVVNDGSTDTTNDILKSYPSLTVVAYPENSGKGHALKKGFACAAEKGFDYVITIDSDGQHSGSDLLKFIEKIEKEGPSLVIGARNMDQDGIPSKSSFGNRFSNFWFWVETGISLPDTQSGYRLYPLCRMKEMKWFTGKYEFEIEVIVRAAWKGIKVSSVPVSVYYAPKGKRISHFRPFMDFFRISLLNTLLVIITFSWINPRNFIKDIFRKESYTNLKEKLFYSEHSELVTSLSVAFGIFMGIIPIWGFQLVAAIFLAILFRLNKLLVIIFANISVPPMIPLIIFLSYKMGALWMGDNAVDLIFKRSITLETIKLNLIQYAWGSITLAVTAALLFGTAAYLLLTIFKKKSRQS